MHTFSLKSFAVSLLVGTVLGANPTTLNAITAESTYDNARLPYTREVSPLDLWIEKLIVLESNGRTDVRVLDVNNRYSYGCLQFQKRTFRAYGVKYGVISETENIDEKIYECELQKALARLMIEDNHENWKHWYTSVRVRKLGPPPLPHGRELARSNK